MIGGLIAVGVDKEQAVPAVFLFRLATFWIPILPGYVAFSWLRRTERLIRSPTHGPLTSGEPGAGVDGGLHDRVGGVGAAHPSPSRPTSSEPQRWRRARGGTGPGRSW